MSWENIIGQSRLKSLLQRTIESKQLAQSYLFFGSDGVGKDAVAIEFAKAINCEKQIGVACDECSICKKISQLQHPNLKLVFALPTTKESDDEDSSERKVKDDSVLSKLSNSVVEEIQSQLEEKANNPYFHIAIEKANAIRIASIREIKRELSLSLFAEGKRVVIIFDAHLMNEEAQNAFLKTLEEPPPSTIIILTTSRIDKLKQTIISRCQQVQFDLLKESEITNALIERKSISESQAKIIAQLANGNYAQALELLGEDLPARREHLLNFLRALATKSIAEISAEAESIAKDFSKQELSQYLTLMLFWFRDVFMLQNGGTIINADQRESLQKFVQRYPTLDTQKAISSIENALSLALKNVYIRLVLTTLALELRTLLQAK